jgi:hypothetical protein
VFTALLAQQAHGALPDFWRKLALFLVHGTILSNVGASTKSGAVQYAKLKASYGRSFNIGNRS